MIWLVWVFYFLCCLGSSLPSLSWVYYLALVCFLHNSIFWFFVDLFDITRFSFLNSIQIYFIDIQLDLFIFNSIIACRESLKVCWFSNCIFYACKGMCFMCVFRFKLWWMTQRMGNYGGDILSETRFLMVEANISTLNGVDNLCVVLTWILITIIESIFRGKVDGVWLKVVKGLQW